MFTDFPILRSEQSLPLYLINMGLHDCQDHIARPDGYPSPQIFFCTKGSGTLLADGKTIPVPAGSAMVLPAAFPHEYYPDGDVWDIHWIVPGGYALQDILGQFDLNRLRVCELSDTRMLEHIFRKMHDAIRADSIFGNYRASGYLYDFLIELYRIISAKGNSGAPSPALMRALDLINANYAQPLGMTELCAAAGVSSQHLCMLFRTALGLRPMEYIARRRIQESKALLTSTSLSIGEIAEQTGFGSESYFCKLFRRYEGITPTSFRNTK